MARQRGWLRNVTEYALARLAWAVAGAAPLPAALRLGEGIGRAAFLLARRRRRIAVENIMRAFGPDMNRKQALYLGAEAFAHAGRVAIETIRAPRLIRPNNFRRFIRYSNEAALIKAQNRGKGVIFVTAHLGNWELGGWAAGLLGLKLHSVYRPSNNPLLADHLRAMRERLGQRAIPKKNALRPMLRALRRGEAVAILADQHAKAVGVWTPFFGRLASTTTAPALLALRAGAPIVIGYCRRLPGTYQFELVTDDPFLVTSTGDRSADVARVMRRVNQRLEAFVRRCPAQWLWGHRRWRAPPVGKEFT